MLRTEASSSSSIDPVEFDDETSPASVDPARMSLQKHSDSKYSPTVFVFTDWMVDPLINQLVHAATDLLKVEKCETSGSGGLLCSRVWTARPCGVSIT